MIGGNLQAVIEPARAFGMKSFQVNSLEADRSIRHAYGAA